MDLDGLINPYVQFLFHNNVMKCAIVEPNEYNRLQTDLTLGNALHIT